MWSEIKRKAFHLTSLLYLVGLILLARSTFVATLTVLLIVEASIEMARLRSPRLNRWFLARFGALFRPSEERRFSGVYWMLLGVLITVDLVPRVELATTALLYLILGDSAASLIGIRLKGPRWPKCEKRVSGSLACLAICLFVGAAVLRPDYGWHGIVIGAVVATAVEAGLLPGNDNITIPVVSGAALLASYGIAPFH